MPGPMRSIVAVGLLAVPPVVTAAKQPVDPSAAWRYLQQVRDRLTEHPQSADFVQTYLPAGFSSGDRETGRLALALPDCIRWDYESPYPRSFILCDTIVYSWNVGETSGRRQRIAAGEERGLDLLRLGVERLRQHYDARLEVVGDGTLEVVLSPMDGSEEIADARFRIDDQHDRLVGISYRDGQGNLTRFEFSDYRRLSSVRLFTPPENIEWLED